MPATPTKALETFANPAPTRDYTIRMQIPEFTCLCPRTGQPDFATLELEYVPDAKCVELKSLKLYIWSFRDRRSSAGRSRGALSAPDGALQRARRHLHHHCRGAPTGAVAAHARGVFAL